MFICIQILLAIFIAVKHANCHHWQIDYTAIRWKSSLLFNFSKAWISLQLSKYISLFLCLRSCVISVIIFLIVVCFFFHPLTLASSCALELDLGFFWGEDICETSMMLYKIQKKRCPERIDYSFRLGKKKKKKIATRDQNNLF